MDNDLGLPEGVELIKFGVAGDDDFELVGGIIFKGQRPGAASGALVRPAKGFSFQPAQTWGGIKDMWIPGPPNAFMSVKQESAPVEITATLKVSVTNSFDKSVVDDVLAQLKRMPGFVSLEIS